MDFLEKWFSISPDGGSGFFEVAVIIVAVTVGFTVFFRRGLQNARQQGMRKIAWLK
jgi:hypothetical protein